MCFVDVDDPIRDDFSWSLDDQQEAAIEGYQSESTDQGTDTEFWESRRMVVNCGLLSFTVLLEREEGLFIPVIPLYLL